MIKLVKRIGNSIGVIFDIEDRELYDLALGKAVDIEIRKVFKLENLKKRLRNNEK